MKSQSIEIIKDLIISILIVACIVLVVFVIFYDKISIGKVIPEAEDYKLSEKMEQDMKESNLHTAEEIIVNYYIDAADLKQYEKTNEYIKGKSNPFAAGNISNTNNNIAFGDKEEEFPIGGSNNSSGNFYEDDGTK